MEKKLTAQGSKDRKSYMVTLPIEWIKARGLDKTRVVDMELVGNTIVISPTSAIKKKVSIDAEQFKDTLEKVIAVFYRMGVDEIKIEYRNSEMIKRIQSIIGERMMGFEIIEHGKNYLIIKDLIKEGGEEFKTVLRRLFLLLLFIAKEITEKIKKKDTQEAYEIIEAEKSINRLSNFCLRLLIKRGHADYAKIPFYLNLCGEIEKLSDEYKGLYLELLKEKKGWSIGSSLSDLYTCLVDAYNLHYDFDTVKYNNGRYAVYSLFKKLTNPQLPYGYFLGSIAKRINALYSITFYMNFDHPQLKKE